MTKREYERLYREVRDKGLTGITREELRRIRDVYIDASAQVSEVVKDATLSQKSLITIESQQQIDNQLRRSASNISSFIEGDVPLAISDGYDMYSQIDAEYIMDVVDRVDGAGSIITQAGLEKAFVRVNEKLITDLTTRMYSDGYTFSERIWNEFGPDGLPTGIHGDYQYRIKNVISSGIAQGRDLFDIAEDIQVYTADGKVALMKRYGRLERGTREFTRRISRQVDWRAVRLVRSELYSSLQSAGVQQGINNPAATDMYDWRLTPGAQHSCICPDLAAAAPYRLQDVPGFPHPNCLCTVIPILMDGDEFRSGLQRWVDGDKVDFMDNWYKTVYLPAQLT